MQSHEVRFKQRRGRVLASIYLTPSHRLSKPRKPRAARLFCVVMVLGDFLYPSLHGLLPGPLIPLHEGRRKRYS